LRVEGPVIVRMDGVSFGKYSKLLGKHRDERLHNALVSSAKELVEYYSCDSAYVSSDEVSVYCKLPPFGGRVEKLVSVFSSFLGSHFSVKVSPLPPGWFDGRVVLAGDWKAYVMWRLKVTVCNYASSVARKPCSQALKEVRLPPEAFGTLLERVEVLKKGYTR